MKELTKEQINTIKSAVKYLTKYRDLIETIPETKLQNKAIELDYITTISNYTANSQLCFLQEIIIKNRKD